MFAVVQNLFLAPKEFLHFKTLPIVVPKKIIKTTNEHTSNEPSGSASLLKAIYIQNEQFMEEDRRVLDAEEQELQSYPSLAIDLTNKPKVLALGDRFEKFGRRC